MPPLNLGDVFPNFDVITTTGKFKIYDWMEDEWAVFFSHPSDFTPVCTTELAKVGALHDEFARRGVKVIGLSCDTLESHMEWIKDIISYGELKSLPYPIIADPNRDIALSLGMLDPIEKDSSGVPLTCRAVFIIDEKKCVRLSLLYPATTGRNFREILRAIDSLQLTDKKKVATPADWEVDEPCMVLPNVPAEEMKSLFPQGRVIEVPSKKQYLRITPKPI